jgi:hypothetical protein
MTTQPEKQPQAADTGAEPIDLSQYGNNSLYEHFQRDRGLGEGEIIRLKDERRDGQAERPRRERPRIRPGDIVTHVTRCPPQR